MRVQRGGAERLRCCRCGVEFDPKRVRYLWVGYGERGAVEFTKQGNAIFGRKREQGADVFCGPCGDQWRERQERFLLGEGLDTFRNARHVNDTWARGVVRD